MVLDHAVTARELDAAGERSGKGAEPRAVVAADEQQVVAAGARRLGVEVQQRPVLAGDAREVLAEADRRRLARLARDPHRSLAALRRGVDAAHEGPRERGGGGSLSDPRAPTPLGAR